jgi:hypothetical protein
MSHSDINRRKCHAEIGVRHHGGRVHIASDVAVILNTDTRNGPILRLTCACGEARDWTIG